MTTMKLEIALRPPGLADRIWYRRLRADAPAATGHTGPWHAKWVRLLPYRWRHVHHAYAATSGYFWLPCVLCDRPYGGHESGGSIPDPTREPGRGLTVCSQCAKQRNG